ncbi:MAG: T9SS type A sorting domain-containing protein [Flavipsychrobacter sp.]
MKLKFLLLLSFAAGIVMPYGTHAQVLVHRLVGIANAQYTASGFSPTDSTALSYSKLRTSNIKTGVYKYDSAVVYTYNSGYSRFSKTTNTFFPNDSVVFFRQYLWADTASKWNIYSSTNFLFNSIERDSIRSVQIDTGSGLDNYEQYLYYYDANKNLKYLLKNTWNGASWFFSDSTIYTYNTSNNLTSRVYKVFFPAGGTYVNSEEDIYSYNTSGQLTKAMHNSWDKFASNWSISGRDLYTYDGSGNLSTIIHFSLDASSRLVPSSKDSNAYDASMNLISSTNMIFDTASKTFVNNTMYAVTYDTSNRPLVYTTQSWNGSGWTYFIGQDKQTHYYYQLYADTSTSVSNVNNIVAFNIYPVPASSFFNININWQNAQPFTISMYDINGRLVKQWTEKATKNYHKAIFTSDLNSGNYFIKVNSDSGQLTQQINIIH